MSIAVKNLNPPLHAKYVQKRRSNALKTSIKLCCGDTKYANANGKCDRLDEHGFVKDNA